MTVLEVIQKSSDFLAKKGVDSPRLQTELLLAHLLKMPRMKLYLNFECALTDGELDSFRELVKRRGQREPLQHITGSTSFCGIEIAVNRHVLVPRPETEILAEFGWQFLNGEGRRSPTALDIGTGSGCIAIALAANCTHVRVTAVDISSEALALAKKNAGHMNGSDRIHFLQGDAFATLPEKIPFDLIISNPPYIPTAEISTLQQEVRDYDPGAALDGGADGLDFYRKFANQAANFLKPGGKLMLEFGDGQAASVGKIFEAEKWVVEAVREDYSRRARIVILTTDEHR